MVLLFYYSENVIRFLLDAERNKYKFAFIVAENDDLEDHIVDLYTDYYADAVCLNIATHYILGPFWVPFGSPLEQSLKTIVTRQPIEIQIFINGYHHVERATPSDGPGAVAALIIPGGHQELPIRKLRSQRKKQTNSNEWLAKAEANMLNVQWKSDQHTHGWTAVVNEYLYYRSDNT